MTAAFLAGFLACASGFDRPPPPQADRPTVADAPVAVPVASPEAMAYYRDGNLLWIVRQAIALAIPAIVLFTGISARIRNLARRLGRKWFFTVLLYFIFYSVLYWVLQLPLEFYGAYVLQHAYGQSNQTLGKWLRNAFLEGAIELAFGGLLIWLPYWLLYRSPRRWWLYTAVLSLPVMLFVMLIEPIWVQPLFNRFERMHDSRLEEQILGLAAKAGIEGGRIFEVDKSADTKALNAYVIGLGSSKRIVLWDTLLKKLDTSEVRVVMAHEMGHYVLNHLLQGLAAGFCGILVALYMVHRAASFLLPRCNRRFGFAQLSDVASLPLLLLLVQAAVLLLTPAGLAFSRHLEHEADRFALELTRDNHAAGMAFVHLQAENLSNPSPGPLYTFFRGSHPSLAQRIEFANDYHPWKEGKPLKYGRLFHSPPPSSEPSSAPAGLPRDPRLP